MAENARTGGSLIINKKERSARAARAGSVKTEAKAAAARANGALGGRPGNPAIRQIMDERGCSRQRAHQILKRLSG